MSDLAFADKLNVSRTRVLVVEDCEPFREFINSILVKSIDLQIIGECSDGLEAVRKAEELQPGLILLDIGLPGLNGFEVAKRIFKFVPKPKIVFLTQESCADIVHAALSLGALGYVAKASAGSDLLVAIEAVVQGNQFVSASLKCPVPTDME
ncbi:MAG TPA: response regulator transcription factor [Candidatus Acidoferrales bacterium]|jgi:DNA-binding NarL/FixJ family response regulator